MTQNVDDGAPETTTEMDPSFTSPSTTHLNQLILNCVSQQFSGPIDGPSNRDESKLRFNLIHISASRVLQKQHSLKRLNKWDGLETVAVTERFILATQERDAVSIMAAGINVEEHLLLSTSPTLSHILLVNIAKVDTTGWCDPITRQHELVRNLLNGYQEFLVQSKLASQIRVHILATPNPEYLFPKSMTNSRKRLVKGRQLTFWWRRVMDYQPRGNVGISRYWMIPNLDENQLPSHFRLPSLNKWHWQIPYACDGAKAIDTVPKFAEDAISMCLERSVGRDDGVTSMAFYHGILSHASEFKDAEVGLVVVDMEIKESQSFDATLVDKLISDSTSHADDLKRMETLKAMLNLSNDRARVNQVLTFDTEEHAIASTESILLLISAPSCKSFVRSFSLSSVTSAKRPLMLDAQSSPTTSTPMNLLTVKRKKK